MKNILNLFRTDKQIRTALILSELNTMQAEPLNSTFTAQYKQNEINRLKAALINL